MGRGGKPQRFCGPATTVTVPCTSPPRLCVKTLGQAVSWTGECYTARITLFPEQLDLLRTAHPRLFVIGPPGTGKTVVLLLKAREWLRCRSDIYIVSTWWGSRAACSMLYHLLLRIVNTHLTSVASPGQPHLLQYDFTVGKDVEKAVNELSLAARSESLYAIADEVYRGSEYFENFCDKLLTQVPHLHFWAARCYHELAPAGWYLKYLTGPLRSPLSVVREVQQDVAITGGHHVLAYSKRGVADYTDGPPVRRLYHRGQGHVADKRRDCVTCGSEVASFLHSLRVPGNAAASGTATAINSSTTSPCIQWRDVLVLCAYDVRDQSGVVTGLKEANIPVQVMKDDDIEDVVMARGSDVVWVADGNRLQGLERKVIVSLDPDDVIDVRLKLLSRCTSQLVTVSR